MLFVGAVAHQQEQVEQSLLINQSPYVSRRSFTLLAASTECGADVQRYCNKGYQQIISNLEVL
jgi:hypothetical protein